MRNDWLRREKLEEEIIEHKEEVEKYLSTIIRQDLVKPFIDLLSFGHHEDTECADILAKTLGLSKADFCAIDLDLDKYEDIFYERVEADRLDAQMSAYEDYQYETCAC